MASRDRKADAEDCKARGNEALQAKDFDRAIEWYNEAIKLHEDHVYYSNRSAAYLSKGFGDSALKDALKCIELKPDWSKGYSRKGAALHKLGKFEEAIATYEKGLELEPNNAALKQGIEAVQSAMSGGGRTGLEAMFGGLVEKAKANPNLAKYVSDPTYVQLLSLIEQNPQMLQMAAQDPRIRETLQEILGIRFETSPSETPEEIEKRKKEAKEKERKRKEDEEERKRKEAEEAERIRRENETPEERELRERKEKAIEKKNEGNVFYKKKEFEEAIKLYEEAIELDPENTTFYLNVASAKMEKGDLDGCLESCKKAIEVGRKVFVGYDQIAKAYERMGNAYFKFKMWKEAIEQYQAAQLEHANPDVANRLKKAENFLKKAEAESYINPELAAAAKEKGNEKFKAGDFPGSIEHYSEAVKRDPSNPVYYGNRSAAYMKLADFGRAMDDCKKAIELDPKYVKMFARKGNIEFFLKEYHKALRTYQEGLDLDPQNQECAQGLQKTRIAVQTSSGQNDNERATRAMEDPEIRNIMQDPVMQQVLQDMSTNPQSAAKHMSNPEIASKIETLIAAGVLRTK